MKCNVPKETIIDYFYGELEGQDLTQFKEHLDSCKACKEELAMLELPSEAMPKWKVATPNMNVVFVAEQETFVDRVKNLFPFLKSAKVKPVAKFGYSLAAVFLFMSLINFNFSYSPDTGSFTMSTSLLGKADPGLPVVAAPANVVDHEELSNRLLQTQVQLVDFMTQLIAEKETDQRELWNTTLTNLLETIDSRRRQELQDVTSNIQTVVDGLGSRIEDNQSKYSELVKTVGAEKKQQ